MIGVEFLAVMNQSGPDTGGTSMANGTLRDQSGALMYVSAASRVVLRVKVAFDVATVLTGISFQFVGSGDGTNFGQLLTTRNDTGATGTLHNITPADVTASPGGKGVFLFDCAAHFGMDGGVKIQAEGIGGAPKAGDNITVDVRAM